MRKGLKLSLSPRILKNQDKEIIKKDYTTTEFVRSNVSVRRLKQQSLACGSVR
jgi:hypothetical protein